MYRMLWGVGQTESSNLEIKFPPLEHSSVRTVYAGQLEGCSEDSMSTKKNLSPLIQNEIFTLTDW
jgi:hypothetical protein